MTFINTLSLFFRENRQRILLKHQALFSLNDKSKKLECHLLQFLFGTLRVKIQERQLLHAGKSLKIQTFLVSVCFGKILNIFI